MNDNKKLYLIKKPGLDKRCRSNLLTINMMIKIKQCGQISQIFPPFAPDTITVPIGNVKQELT